MSNQCQLSHVTLVTSVITVTSVTCHCDMSPVKGGKRKAACQSPAFCVSLSQRPKKGLKWYLSRKLHVFMRSISADLLVQMRLKCLLSRVNFTKLEILACILQIALPRCNLQDLPCKILIVSEPTCQPVSILDMMLDMPAMQP